MANQDAREQIISGIVDEAGRQAEEALAEANKAAAERLRSARAQADRLADQDEARVGDQIAKIKKEAQIRLAAAKRRLNLELRESAYKNLVARCTVAIADLVAEDRYRDTVRGWIVEAVGGLQADRATVSCSDRELAVVREEIEQAEADVMSRYGREVSLSMSEGPSLPRQGIIVTAGDGRTAFNNQVHSRLERFQTEIRKLLTERLFQE